MPKQKNKSNKKIFPILLIIMTLLMGVGYASVNSIILDIKGKVSSLNQDNVYITDIKYINDLNANMSSSTINNAYQTMINSTIILSSTDINSYITYEITVYNSANIDFSYLKTSFDYEFYDNDNITFELTNLNVDDTIKPKQYLKFNITFKYKEGITPSSTNNSLNCYLNFLFLHKIRYLESSGEQYIDTGIKPNQSTTLEMEFSFNNLETQAVYGTRTRMDNGVYHNLFLYNDTVNKKLKLRWDENGVQKFSDDVHITEDKKIKLIKNVDNVIVTTNDRTIEIDNPHIEWELDSTAYIFSQNQQDTPETRHASMKLYYLKMYDNGALVRDFLPVLDKEGIACLYDLVTNTYFYNLGTGTFKYSDEYQVLEYLESTGEQYIDTGIKPNNNTKAEMVIAFNNVTSDTQSVFGSRVDQVNNTFNMFLYRGLLRWDFHNTITNPTYSADLTNATYVRVGSDKVEINADITELNHLDTFNSNYNIYLYAVNNSNNVIFPSNGMKVYYFKLYQDENTILNLVPVKDSSGTLCFYDTVSRTYFYNKGTGNFISN